MSITCRSAIRYICGKFDERRVSLWRRELATAPEALPYELRSEREPAM
jgi:hypothetical protein